MRIRERNAGEFFLRFARSRGYGERRFLDRILRDDDQRFLAQALIQEKLEEELGEGFSLKELFDWLKDNEETIKKIIAFITALFA